MPIRPVEVQGVLHRTNELQRAAAVHREQQHSADHQFFTHFEQQSAKAQQTVSKGNEAEKSATGQGGQRPKGERQRSRPRKRQPEAKVPDESKGTRLDIKA
jgi:hypothetical protein